MYDDTSTWGCQVCVTYAYCRILRQVFEQVQRQLHPPRVARMGRPYHELTLLQLLNQSKWEEDQTWCRLSQGKCIKAINGAGLQLTTNFLMCVTLLSLFCIVIVACIWSFCVHFSAPAFSWNCSCADTQISKANSVWNYNDRFCSNVLCDAVWLVNFVHISLWCSICRYIILYKNKNLSGTVWKHSFSKIPASKLLLSIAFRAYFTLKRTLWAVSGHPCVWSLKVRNGFGWFSSIEGLDQKLSSEINCFGICSVEPQFCQKRYLVPRLVKGCKT